MLGILLHIHFCQVHFCSQAETPGHLVNTYTEKQKNNPHTYTVEGNGCASFMDVFNVEVTVTLMLNMLDEVTNTVQLIKFDYAGKKRDITTGYGLGIITPI